MYTSNLGNRLDKITFIDCRYGGLTTSASSRHRTMIKILKETSKVHHEMLKKEHQQNLCLVQQEQEKICRTQYCQDIASIVHKTGDIAERSAADEKQRLISKAAALRQVLNAQKQQMRKFKPDEGMYQQMKKQALQEINKRSYRGRKNPSDEDISDKQHSDVTTKEIISRKLQAIKCNQLTQKTLMQNWMERVNKSQNDTLITKTDSQVKLGIVSHYQTPQIELVKTPSPVKQEKIIPASAFGIIGRHLVPTRCYSPARLRSTSTQQHFPHIDEAIEEVQCVEHSKISIDDTSDGSILSKAKRKKKTKSSLSKVSSFGHKHSLSTASSVGHKHKSKKSTVKGSKTASKLDMPSKKKRKMLLKKGKRFSIKAAAQAIQDDKSFQTLLGEQASNVLKQILSQDDASKADAGDHASSIWPSACVGWGQHQFHRDDGSDVSVIRPTYVGSLIISPSEMHEGRSTTFMDKNKGSKIKVDKISEEKRKQITRQLGLMSMKCLQCRYLRLTPANIAELEKLCKAAGMNPHHLSYKEIGIEDVFAKDSIVETAVVEAASRRMSITSKAVIHPSKVKVRPNK